MPYGKGTYGNKVGRPPKKTQKPVMEMQKKPTETKARVAPPAKKTMTAKKRPTTRGRRM